MSATWAAMEKLLDTGKVKAIGVSNFNQRRIEELLKTAKVVPAANQIEAHPYLQQESLKKYLKEKNIHITAYSPLGNNIYGKDRVLDDPKVQEVAKELGVDVAQLLIAWAVKRGTSVVPKSVTKSRIESNFQRKLNAPAPPSSQFLAFMYYTKMSNKGPSNTEIELSDAAFEKLNALERGVRYNDPLNWGYDIFDEHTPEETQKAMDDWVKENYGKNSIEQD